MTCDTCCKVRSLKNGDPFFMFDPGNSDALVHARGLLWTICGGMAAMVVWFIAAWGAYRELNRLSAFRSAVAALAFLILSIPVSAILLAFASFAVIAEVDQ